MLSIKISLFAGLVEFMISGPIMLQVLAGKDAIQRYRDLMGATDPLRHWQEHYVLIMQIVLPQMQYMVLILSRPQNEKLLFSLLTTKYVPVNKQK